MPKCVPFLLLSPCRALGTPETARVARHYAHMWATFHSVPRYEALGIPETVGVR